MLLVFIYQILGQVSLLSKPSVDLMLATMASTATRTKHCGFPQQTQLRKLAQNMGQQVKTFTVEGAWNKLANLTRLKMPR